MLLAQRESVRANAGALTGLESKRTLCRTCERSPIMTSITATEARKLLYRLVDEVQETCLLYTSPSPRDA